MNTDTDNRGYTPCEVEPELWFSSKPAEMAEAKAACMTCPSLAACTRAIDDIEGRQRIPEWGIWAGMTPEERTGRDPMPVNSTSRNLSRHACLDCGELTRTVTKQCTRCQKRDVRDELTPGRIRRRPYKVTYAAWVELDELGVSRAEAARRLGIQPASLDRAIQRHEQQQDGAA